MMSAFVYPFPYKFVLLVQNLDKLLSKLSGTFKDTEISFRGWTDQPTDWFEPVIELTLRSQDIQQFTT